MSLILSERDGPVAILTLNNPARYNALAPDLLAALNASLDAVMADAAVRVVVLTGAGRGFCAGAELGGPTFEAGSAVGDWMRQHVTPLIERLRLSGKPVICAVNGPAAGAGVGVALAADLVLAARSARFVLSFVKLGAVLDAGTSLLLQRSIGTARTRALALTGESLSAERAADWGLIWRCVDDADLKDEACALARRLADGPPLSIAMIRQQLDGAWAADLSDTLAVEADMQARAFATADLKEGAAAFVEKRSPRFNGR